MSNNDLRRTFGRMMNFAGDRLEEIMTALGHSETWTTILYLGLDYEDQSSAMSQYAQFQKDNVARKWAFFEKASVSGGQRGI